MIYNEKAFKQATKNLNKELSTIGFDLSHGATLNLMARTLGFKDYNTIKPALIAEENAKQRVEDLVENMESRNIQILNLLDDINEKTNDKILEDNINKIKRIYENIEYKGNPYVSDSSIRTLLAIAFFQLEIDEDINLYISEMSSIIITAAKIFHQIKNFDSFENVIELHKINKKYQEFVEAMVFHIENIKFKKQFPICFLSIPSSSAL